MSLEGVGIAGMCCELCHTRRRRTFFDRLNGVIRLRTIFQAEFFQLLQEASVSVGVRRTDFEELFRRQGHIIKSSRFRSLQQRLRRGLWMSQLKKMIS